MRNTSRVKEGERVRVFFGESTAPGAAPCLGTVVHVCVAVAGVFVMLDAEAPADAWHRRRFNGHERVVLVYHREVEPA